MGLCLKVSPTLDSTRGAVQTRNEESWAPGFRRRSSEHLKQYGARRDKSQGQAAAQAWLSPRSPSCTGWCPARGRPTTVREQTPVHTWAALGALLATGTR